MYKLCVSGLNVLYGFNKKEWHNDVNIVILLRNVVLTRRGGGLWGGGVSVKLAVDISDVGHKGNSRYFGSPRL